MFEESDDDGHLLQQHRPSCSKCSRSTRTYWQNCHYFSEIRRLSVHWPICKVELSYKQFKSFSPKLVQWSFDTLQRQHYNVNQQMSNQRCHPLGAPIDTVAPDGPHPRVLKEVKLCDCCSFVWHFPSSPTVWWHCTVWWKAGLCDNNLQKKSLGQFP